MSAVLQPRTRPAAVRLVLLGTGTVGTAFRARLLRMPPDAGVPLSLVAEANTRHCIAHEPVALPDDDARASPAVRAVRMLGAAGARVIVDATASDTLAARHAGWLDAGIHVVTACKLGLGTGLARWREIDAARRRPGRAYGDSATVGAGLPLLDSVRRLRAAGECIHGIAGVLSGSLAWLLARHDGRQPFADLVGEAAVRGYTEPDPREDLSGEDVRRKLLILARAAGHALEHDEVRVEPIEPATMDARLRQAQAGQRRLAYVARLRAVAGQRPRASARLESLAPGDPLAQGGDHDNRVAIWSDRYRERALLVQGPGAGAEVTAAALLDDVLRIARATL